MGEWVGGKEELGWAWPARQSYYLRPQAAHPKGYEGPVLSGQVQALRTKYPSQPQEESLSASL